jgi:hypothetical protein
MMESLAFKAKEFNIVPDFFYGEREIISQK